MKGMEMSLLIAIIIAVIVVAGALAIYMKVKSDAEKAGPTAVGAIAGSLFFLRPYRKGISEATNILILVVMVVMVAFILFLIFASIGAEAGPASNNIFYSFFDSIISSLPWMSG